MRGAEFHGNSRRDSTTRILSIKKCNQDLVKNAISPLFKTWLHTKKHGLEKHCIYYIKKTGNHILHFQLTQKCQENKLNAKYFNFDSWQA